MVIRLPPYVTGCSDRARNKFLKDKQMIHADNNPDYPEREAWQPMNFIR